MSTPRPNPNLRFRAVSGATTSAPTVPAGAGAGAEHAAATPPRPASAPIESARVLAPPQRAPAPVPAPRPTPVRRTTAVASARLALGRQAAPRAMVSAAPTVAAATTAGTAASTAAPTAATATTTTSSSSSSSSAATEAAVGAGMMDDEAGAAGFSAAAQALADTTAFVVPFDDGGGGGGGSVVAGTKRRRAQMSAADGMAPVLRGPAWLEERAIAYVRLLKNDTLLFASIVAGLMTSDVRHFTRDLTAGLSHYLATHGLELNDFLEAASTAPAHAPAQAPAAQASAAPGSAAGPMLGPGPGTGPASVPPSAQAFLARRHQTLPTRQQLGGGGGGDNAMIGVGSDDLDRDSDDDSDDDDGGGDGGQTPVIAAGGGGGQAVRSQTWAPGRTHAPEQPTPERRRERAGLDVGAGAWAPAKQREPAEPQRELTSTAPTRQEAGDAALALALTVAALRAEMMAYVGPAREALERRTAYARARGTVEWLQLPEHLGVVFFTNALSAALLSAYDDVTELAHRPDYTLAELMSPRLGLRLKFARLVATHLKIANHDTPRRYTHKGVRAVLVEDRRRLVDWFAQHEAPHSGALYDGLAGAGAGAMPTVTRPMYGRDVYSGLFGA